MKELVDGLTLLTRGTDKEKLKFLFQVYDIDGESIVSLTQFNRMVDCRCTQLTSTIF